MICLVRMQEEVDGVNMIGFVSMNWVTYQNTEEIGMQEVKKTVRLLNTVFE